MSLSTTTSTTASWASAAATAARVASTAASSSSSRQERVPGHVTAAAEALGLDTSEVMSSLQSGKSLFDLADAQGVSRSDLVAALKAGAPQELQDSADAEAMIEALASTSGVGGPGGTGGVGGGRGAGGHQEPPPAPSGTTGVLSGSLTSTQQSTLSALSDLLGTDAESLLGQLQSGTDLTDLLSAKGVTLDQLSSKLEEGLLIGHPGVTRSSAARLHRGDPGARPRAAPPLDLTTSAPPWSSRAGPTSSSCWSGQAAPTLVRAAAIPSRIAASW